MTTMQREPAVFRYPVFNQIMADWPLLLVATCAFLSYEMVHRGEDSIGAMILIGGGGIFFLFMWMLGRSQLRTIMADAHGIRTDAFWGLVRHDLPWSMVERVEYVTIEDPLRRFTIPKTYYLSRKPGNGEAKKPWRLSVATTLTDFPAFLAILEAKSGEFGFPIAPMP